MEPDLDRDAAFNPDFDEPDFAGEHDEATFADETDGGPEHARDSASPRGLSGMDEDEHD